MIKEKKLENFEYTSLEETIRGTNFNKVPIWLMRQAGRYLEEYRAVRNTTNSFLEFCYNPNKASEVTIQPIERFNLDAAIIFSDILVIPDALGSKVNFISGEGPVLDKLVASDVNQLVYNESKLKPVYEAIKIVRKKLDKKKSLIGFAGSPWTISTYMVEGGGSRDFHKVKSWAYSDPQSFSKLIYILSDSIVLHACRQIEAGANVFQLFDSWAGALASGEEFLKWVIEPTSYIINKIKEKHPNVPIIGFPKGAGASYIDYAKRTKVDVLSVDCHTSLKWISDNVDVALQGNLDPILLKNDITRTINDSLEILNLMKGKRFIFNLGHGILPETPVVNVKELVNLVINYR